MSNILSETTSNRQDNRIYIANAVIHHIPEYRELINMWEDSELQAYEEAESLFEWLNESAPHTFILIDTGEYFIPDCARNDLDCKHYHCEVYDAHYRLLLVSRVVWDACKDDVLAKNAEYRTQVLKCKLEAK